MSLPAVGIRYTTRRNGGGSVAGLSVVFRAVDEISTRFDAMANAGVRALDLFDRIGAAADSSYDVISEGAAGAADAMERASAATD